MTLKSYLLSMSVLTAFCWGIFIFVAGLVNPELTNWLGFLLFYLSLFAALSGTIFLLGFIFRFVALKKELAFNLVRNAFRQAFLLALFIVIILVLKAQDLFTWLNLSLLVFIFAVLELFVSGYKKNR